MKKLKVGIIGAGSLSECHIEAYRRNPHVEVACLCDSNGARAEKKAGEWGIGEAFSDYNKMLSSADIDAVSIITPNCTHAPIAIAALNAGKHVLCEKPPALNSREAAEILNASRSAGKLLMFGLVRRFAEKTVVLKDFIDKGVLGNIYYTKTGYLRRSGNPGGWFADPAVSGGGPLIDLGVHIIDLAMYLMGKPRPVTAFGCTYANIGERGNIKGVGRYKAADQAAGRDNEKKCTEDLANAMIKFDNGASLFVETSWTSNIKQDVLYMDLFGDKGGAKLDPGLEIYGESNDYLIDIKPVLDNYEFDFKQAFSSEIDHFVDCLINGTPCLAPAEDGVTLMKVIDAIYRSADSGHEECI